MSEAILDHRFEDFPLGLPEDADLDAALGSSNVFSSSLSARDVRTERMGEEPLMHEGRQVDSTPNESGQQASAEVKIVENLQTSGPGFMLGATEETPEAIIDPRNVDKEKKLIKNPKGPVLIIPTFEGTPLEQRMSVDQIVKKKLPTNDKGSAWHPESEAIFPYVAGTPLDSGIQPVGLSELSELSNTQRELLLACITESQKTERKKDQPVIIRLPVHDENGPRSLDYGISEQQSVDLLFKTDKNGNYVVQVVRGTYKQMVEYVLNWSSAGLRPFRKYELDNASLVLLREDFRIALNPRNSITYDDFKDVKLEHISEAIRMFCMITGAKEPEGLNVYEELMDKEVEINPEPTAKEASEVSTVEEMPWVEDFTSLLDQIIAFPDKSRFDQKKFWEAYEIYSYASSPKVDIYGLPEYAECNKRAVQLTEALNTILTAKDFENPFSGLTFYQKFLLKDEGIADIPHEFDHEAYKKMRERFQTQLIEQGLWFVDARNTLSGILLHAYESILNSKNPNKPFDTLTFPERSLLTGLHILNIPPKHETPDRVLGAFGTQDILSGRAKRLGGIFPKDPTKRR